MQLYSKRASALWKKQSESLYMTALIRQIRYLSIYLIATLQFSFLCHNQAFSILFYVKHFELERKLHYIKMYHLYNNTGLYGSWRLPSGVLRS